MFAGLQMIAFAEVTRSYRHEDCGKSERPTEECANKVDGDQVARSALSAGWP
jgi:hypothetical protein